MEQKSLKEQDTFKEQEVHKEEDTHKEQEVHKEEDTHKEQEVHKEEDAHKEPENRKKQECLKAHEEHKAQGSEAKSGITDMGECTAKKKGMGKIPVCILILLVVAGTLIYFLLPKIQRGNLPQLPMLTISKNTDEFKTFDAYPAYSGEDFVSANPWDENTEIEVLPVYKNPMKQEGTQQATEEDSAQNILLPEEYVYYFDAGYEDAIRIAEYIKETHGELMDMSDPQVNVHGGNYSIYNNPLYTISFFEGGDNLTDSIVNYSLNTITFQRVDEEEALYPVRFAPDLSEKMGDYPIISVDEAIKLLKKDNYITTVLCQMPGEEYIGKVELIYRTESWQEYYMPYYRFYVEMPTAEMDSGIKMYGMYYVPAVNKAYISNMPKWELTNIQ